MEDFDEIANQIHKDRIMQEEWNSKNIDNLAKLEYSRFCVWCRVFKNSDFSEQNFKEYQKEENLKFNFWLKKRIAELFFGYEFKFDYDTMKWSSEKK